ncbi:Bug family tripartite tricarboxylate transporter substrate binding protein [Ramlibacter sp.]|uniref:Bug family tripartite tricarboxylate transporter substrate binding protein n=1 Tax=Ramlibacter sp. TaxID=1917967 RepID=UPI003D0A603E
MNRRRSLIRLTFAGMLAPLASAVRAQDFPNRPMRLVVPYPPGGGITPLARLYGEKITEALGQAVIVDNRPGGNTAIGTDAVAKAPPDGHTLLLTLNTHALLPFLQQTPYDALKDFTPIASIAAGEQLMVVPSALPVNSLQELIAMAKAKPGELNYASAGAGTINHVSGESFKLATGIRMAHVPYKGGGPAIIDLIAGRVQMYMAVPLSLIPHIESGRLKPIAITGDKRFPALPNVPTFAEAGLAGFDARASYWVLAPANTPRAIAERLSSELGRISNLPDMRERLSSLGLAPFVSNPDQLARLMQADSVRFGQVVKTANIKLDN